MNPKFLRHLALPLIIAGVLAFQPPAHSLSLHGDWTSTFWNREVPALQNRETRWQAYESLRVQAQQDDVGIHLHSRMSRLEDWDARLYQGYLDWRLALVRLRVGRQFLPNDVGFWQMDGLRASLRRRLLRLAFYGGSAVTPWGESRSGVAGVDVQLMRPPFARTRGSVMTVFDEEGVQRLIVGGQLGTLGGSLLGVHRTTEPPAQLYGRFHVDVLSQSLVSGYGFASTGIRQANLYAEYQRETPLFPEASIFTVFAVEPLEQLAVGVRLQPFRLLTLDGRYAHQFYEADDLHRYRAGIQIGPLASYLERIDEDAVEYWRVRSQLSFTSARWMARLSHYYNDYRKSPASPFETAYSYQLQLYYLLGRQLQLMLRLEDNVNPDFEYNLRALGSIRWRFRTTQ